MYWHNGFINSPIIVKECLKSWKYFNSDYEIIELNDDNLIHWININDLIKNKNITIYQYKLANMPTCQRKLNGTFINSYYIKKSICTKDKYSCSLLWILKISFYICTIYIIK